MHELSIALSIVEGATEEAQKHNGAKVEAVHLKLGKLSGVVKDSLLFSYNVACEGTILEGSRLEIKEVPVIVFCPNCNEETTPVSIQNFCCSVCESPTAKVVRGRELLIVGLELNE